MKLQLYNYSLPIVFSYCEKVLKKMAYEIHHVDFKSGLISASKGEGVRSLSSLLDLRFSSEKFSVGIVVISSSMSNIFGNIYSNPEGEKEFVENLFEQLEARKISIPFLTPEENLVEAMAC